jgi:hypothetical protein
MVAEAKVRLWARADYFELLKRMSIKVHAAAVPKPLFLAVDHSNTTIFADASLVPSLMVAETNVY